MNTKVQRLIDYLILRTDYEKNERIFWTHLTLHWEDPKVKIGDKTEWKSHVLKLWWDKDRLGWVNHRFDWSRDVQPRFIWIEYSRYPQSDDLFDFDVFHNPQEMIECLEVGTSSTTLSLELFVHEEGIQEFSLIGIELKPDPHKRRDEVIQRLRESENKKTLVIDKTPTDENGHIHIDDWNPYHDETVGSEDEHWDYMIWKEITNEVSESINLDDLSGDWVR